MTTFSAHSLQMLEGVHPDLVRVAIKARESIAFIVTEGLRTLAREKEMVKEGKSQTLNSRHLPGPNGQGRAFDFAAFDEYGTVTWNDGAYPPVAEAIRLAAIELKIPVVWGACWLAPLNNYPSALQARADYIASRKALGKKPFLDIDHFELDRTVYP